MNSRLNEFDGLDTFLTTYSTSNQSNCKLMFWLETFLIMYSVGIQIACIAYTLYVFFYIDTNNEISGLANHFFCLFRDSYYVI